MPSLDDQRTQSASLPSPATLTSADASADDTLRSSSEHSHGHIVFTRQLWRRRMPNDPIEVPVSRQTNADPASDVQGHNTRSTRTSSTVSTRSVRPPTSPSAESRTPLTPEESPPYRSTRKRPSSSLEDDDRSYPAVDSAPTHSHSNSGDQGSTQVCICQPDPKIPRPRNAFILYRQHHQAKVIAEHPGLANPEISKIIGEQWRNQPPDVKNEWKRLAEEEKVRHQQQYPTYRYQPRRNTRRGSVTEVPGTPGEKARCPKCGGRTVIAPQSYSGSSQVASPSASVPPSTPLSAGSQLSRTLPVLGELSLQSPVTRRMGRPYHPEMSPRHDDRDDPLSPDSKRRRFNTDQPLLMYRAVPQRYAVAPGPPPQYTYAQTPAYPPATHARRESLPSLHLVGPQGPMPPPPRPGMGYQAHRLSQGHAAPDRSLTLPPLQTGSSATKSAEAKSAKEVIMDMPLSEKLEVLRRIAPPARVSGSVGRGPFIAIEGDDFEAIQQLAQWLVDVLKKEEELTVRLVSPPDVKEGSEDSAMADYHLLAAEWLAKSKTLLSELTYTLPTPPTTGKSSAMSVDGVEKPDVEPASNMKKPVLVVPAYSLHATNIYACRIPITDVYSPKEHWQWSATLWRGIIGPDLTIYVRDATANDTARAVEQSENDRLFVVKRTKAEGTEELEIDSTTLRRLGFEIGEYCRAHGAKRSS